MQLELWSGEDEITIADALHVFSARDVERFDVAALPALDDLWTACATEQGLFSAHRVLVVDHAELLSAEFLRSIVVFCNDVPTPRVILRARAAFPATAKRVLGKTVPARSFPRPTAASASGWVAARAEQHQVSLTAADRQLIVSRAAHDPERMESVLRQLSLSGRRTPTRRQLEILLGSSAPPSLPWTITDALERGDLPAALATAANQEPIPTLAFLAKRVWQLGRLVELADHSPDACAQALGIAPFAASKLLRLIGRLPADAPAQAARIVWHAELAARSGTDPGEALESALLRLFVVLRPQ